VVHWADTIAKVATKSSLTFTGTVILPAGTSIGTVSSTEIGYMDNVTSSVQTQLNARALLTDTTKIDTKTLDQVGHTIKVDTSASGIATQYDLGGITNLRGDLTIVGNLKYGFIHAVGSVDATSYTPSVSQNVYTKLVPTIVWREQDGLTCRDSIQILTAGDYRVDVSIALSGNNANDFWRLKVYKNGVAFSPELGRFRWRNTSSGVTDTRSYFWYLTGLAANDWISFRITNETASRNPTITDMKVYIEQKPE
jgi:hypothetical protein